jgi:dTDP-4-amino-4,6-dideoxygalactose transaminase
MMTTGEGGMVLTDDREICDKVLDLREYDKRDLGRVRYNFKMTDMQAALGLSQLRKLRSFIARRRRIASIYRDRLSGFGAVMPRACSHERPVFYRFVILADGIPRLQRRARARGVTCERPVWRPLHNLLKSPGCPNSGYVYGRALSIPIYPGLTDEEVEYVAGTLATILR